MENAANALKIAFGIFVFIVGLAVVFNMTSQAREVSRVLISETDRTNSYLHYDDSQYTQKVDPNTGNRIVTIDEIIPVLYRYAEENYAVTIVNGSKEIIARFDLDTENICSSWGNVSNANSTNKYKFMDSLDNDVFNNPKISGLVEWQKITDYDPDRTDQRLSNQENAWMIERFEKWYGRTKNGSNAVDKRENSYACDWLRQNGIYISKN